MLWTGTSLQITTTKSHHMVVATNSAQTSVKEFTKPSSQPPSVASHAPLLYHISPGSTGSRTLYHATCIAGFPSVHHKSFCISSNRGIDGVSPRVVDGVRAHLQVLRLYQIAYKCCSYWDKGNILQDIGDGKITFKGGEDGEMVLQLCSMSIHDWAIDVQSQLSAVLQSGLVGLFDTPYPLLAPQVLIMATKLRTIPTIVAMTERNATDWARSRSKNHNLLLCKKDYSYEGLGASEFDILGCVERAGANLKASGGDKDVLLHFWDVFEYRSRFQEADSEDFLKGLEVQMEHHQSVYKKTSKYAPNFFGSSATLNESNHHPSPSSRLTEKQVAHDIQHLMLVRNESQGAPGSVDNNQILWSKKNKTASLTCRGAVQYHFLNDTFMEYYDHPKTCDLNLDSVEKEWIV
jgi:hypothetical protein